MKIVRQCEDWLIVDKPSGVLVHPTRPDGTPTLWHSLKELFPNEDIALVNRLDRETSGLILVSRHRQAASTLGKAMMSRHIQKSYDVLVNGVAPAQGEIDAPIARINRDEPRSPIYIKRAVMPNGEPAHTRFERIETRTLPTGNPISWLKVYPTTGRLHQIRVHLSHLGHYVLGDKIYGADELCYLRFIETGWTPELASTLLYPRHALHASGLGFEWNGEPLNVTIPLPEDMQGWWQETTASASLPA